MYRKYTQAFTLIELLVVMAIILIIAGMLVSVGGPASKSAKKRKAEVMISALEVAIGMYKADTGGYPLDTGAGFTIPSQVLYDYLTNKAKYGAGGTSPKTGWDGPYMQFKGTDLSTTTPYQILDPWKKSYNYDSSSPITHNTYSFDLWSNGPDGKTATVAEKLDDKTNW
jgi:general secretion pathway protein G